MNQLLLLASVAFASHYRRPWPRPRRDSQALEKSFDALNQPHPSSSNG